MKPRSMIEVGLRVFEKEGGPPLPLNKGVLDACDLGPYTKAETLTKIDPKCRRVFETKAGHECTRCPAFLKQSET